MGLFDVFFNNIIKNADLSFIIIQGIFISLYQSSNCDRKWVLNEFLKFKLLPFRWSLACQKLMLYPYVFVCFTNCQGFLLSAL